MLEQLPLGSQACVAAGFVAVSASCSCSITICIRSASMGQRAWHRGGTISGESTARERENGEGEGRKEVEWRYLRVAVGEPLIGVPGIRVAPDRDAEVAGVAQQRVQGLRPDRPTRYRQRRAVGYVRLI